MDKSQAIEKAIEYSKLVNERIKVQKILLYGSYAKDNWNEESDIDIAVIVDTVDGDFLDMASMLYRLRRHVDDRIEPVLLEQKADPSGFLSEILKHSEVIYTN
ncbi:MAG: nucleotidyltransferase domain-containing protein [Syntrophomonadaceae bacterium]|jgi:predicted nucleotidyltransferase|nr:nucleotidyltransferase domain-containing protein [Syntrophomonadaceae bacterium]